MITEFNTKGILFQMFDADGLPTESPILILRPQGAIFLQQEEQRIALDEDGVEEFIKALRLVAKMQIKP